MPPGGHGVLYWGMLPSENYEVLVLEELIHAGRKADAVKYLRERTGYSPQQASEIVNVMQAVLKAVRPPDPRPSRRPSPGHGGA